ncbi:MAG: HAD family hydrolase [Chloroflexi bacterium]|nr:HAD family hydrolase [Chloroflexota bacterium]
MSAGSPPLEAVVFDWGGTLTPFHSIEMEDMWRLAARHLAAHLPDDESAITARLMDVERAFWDRTAADACAGSLGDLLAEATRALGVDVAEAVLEEAGVRYLDAWTPHITHDPDAAPTLRALRERGLRIGLLSNTHWPRTFHEHFLERDGLAGLIDARLYTSEMTHMKPHPEAFRAALAALGVLEPARAVFVGDRPFDDIHGARRSGLRAVLRPHPDVPAYDVRPDAEIARLPELVPLVDRWGTVAGARGRTAR